MNGVKTVKVSTETHRRLGELGRTNETYGEVITRLVLNEENAEYIAVDSDNNWLVSGSFKNSVEALKAAKEADAYDPQAQIYIYRGPPVLMAHKDFITPEAPQ